MLPSFCVCVCVCLCVCLPAIVCNICLVIFFDFLQSDWVYSISRCYFEKKLRRGVPFFVIRGGGEVVTKSRRSFLVFMNHERDNLILLALLTTAD